MRFANSMTQQQYRQLQQHKDPRRQYQGKVNQDMGKQFESLVDNACLFYQSANEAEIIKTPEPLRPLKPLGNGQFVACFKEKAQADYKGTLKGGQSIAFEAKHTTTGKMEQGKVTKNKPNFWTGITV